MLSQQKSRTGPHPLPLYMGAAQFSKITASNPLKLQQMISGIQKYQKFNKPLERINVSSVWKEGEVSLLHFPAGNGQVKAPGLFLVPSLINKSYIFDLHPEQSFARYMAKQGMEVYLLDWGKSTYDDRQQNFETLITKRLLPAISFAQQDSGKDMFALGYCMGGTILAAAAQHTAALKGVCFLATPWDFSQSHPELLRLIQGPFNPVSYFGDDQKTLPASYLQALFASLDPDKAVEKFVAFDAADPASRAAELFVAAEDWLNDGVDLPRDIATECLEGWFGHNTTVSGNWCIEGEAIDLSKLQIPSLIVASHKDRLVSYGSAVAMADNLKKVQHIAPDCGHIGMMAGRKAIDEVWNPILRWIQSIK